MTLQPFGADLSHLVQRLEHIRIQHFGVIGAIEPLDEGILIWSARLDVPQFDPTLRTPGHEAIGDEFWPICKLPGQ